MARQDGAQDCREHGDASAVVEKTLAVEDRLEPGRRPQPAEEAHDRYRVGGGDDRAEQEQEEEKALRGAHRDASRPPADQTSRHTTDSASHPTRLAAFYFLVALILTIQ